MRPDVISSVTTRLVGEGDGLRVTQSSTSIFVQQVEGSALHVRAAMPTVAPKAPVPHADEALATKTVTLPHSMRAAGAIEAIGVASVAARPASLAAASTFPLAWEPDSNYVLSQFTTGKGRRRLDVRSRQPADIWMVLQVA